MFGLRTTSALQRLAITQRALSVFFLGLFYCLSHTAVAETIRGATTSSTTNSVAGKIVYSAGPISLPHLTYSLNGYFTTGTAVTGDCTGTHDPNNANFTCYWNFNDSSTPVGTPAPSGMTASHVYNSTGNYVVDVYACHDGVNLSDQQSRFNYCTYGATAITIIAATTTPSPVTFKLNGPYYGTTGITLSMSQTNSCASNCGQIHWYYGDGLDEYRNTDLPGKRAYAKAGVYQVRAVLKSPYNQNTLAEAVTTAEISDPPPPPPTNQPPVANPGGPYSALVGRPVTMDGLKSTDPEGSALKYNWTFGDGTTAVNQSSSKVTKSYATPGRYTVTLYVNDGSLNSSSVTTYIIVAPIAAILPAINLLLDK